MTLGGTKKSGLSMIKTDARVGLVESGAASLDGATKPWAPTRKPTMAQKRVMERIVQEETQKFMAEMIHRGSGPTIKLLREQADRIKQEELQRLLGRLQPHGVNETVTNEVSISFERLVNKLLHPPLQSLRENADTSHHASMLDALRKLFQLRE